MDVNQTKFHLLDGRNDWGRCQLADDPLKLAERWALDEQPDDPTHPVPPSPLEWDCASRALRLAVRAPLFKALRSTPPLPLSARRGAGRDRYGNWYWIDEAGTGLRFLPDGDTTSQPYWSSKLRDADVAACVVGADFAVCQPPLIRARQLSGLAVTTRHYLVVGDLTEHGVLVFDLHGGGPPLLLRWPDSVPFAPWDLAPTPDGGVLVLDRDNRNYWALDEHFRLLADMVSDSQALFQPSDLSVRPNLLNRQARPRGYPLLTSSPPEGFDPISIEAGPDNSVLILDASSEHDYSLITVYRDGRVLATYTLEDAVQIADDSAATTGGRLFSVKGHDFAYLPPASIKDEDHSCACGCGGKHAPTAATGEQLVYVAEQGGNQVFTFRLAPDQWDADQPPFATPAAGSDYLPLRRWGAKALVAAGDQLFYDFADRWVPLVPFIECHYEQKAVLRTSLPIDHSHPEQLIGGGPFDSGEPDCVWHRLLLDAQIPAGTTVHISARAANDWTLLEQTAWRPQPDPYLRGQGAELPFYDPWADRRNGPLEDLERTGTWELLFQEIRGRYIQIELTAEGSGRTTPSLRALRAWFPRFSYNERYLPAIYREEPVAASFMERFLANFEGFYTGLEEQIEHASMLFDPRTAPPATLDWLACWIGLAFDPIWSQGGREDRRRFFIRHAERLYRIRGTVAGVLAAVRLYIEACVDESVFNECAASRARLRLIERFRTRSISGLALGDTTAPGTLITGPPTPAIVALSAHRFTLLVPHDLSADDLAMVERIVELEKPAHTACEIKRYWDLFRVGEARLGIDTALGESGQFVPHVLGAGYLAETYLEAPYPFDLSERIVSDRDMLGDMHPL